MAALYGKVALVTGASRGIGAATAEALAAEGAAVVLAARSLGDCETVAAGIAERGGQAFAVACDVTCHADLEAAVATATERFGRLDILVNNAGLIEPIARIADSDPEGWDRVVDVNLKGVYHGIRAAVPAMGDGGVIVNISSGAAVNVLEGWSHYCATKAGVLSLTRAADLELGPAGIRVVGLSPGTVATEMQRQIRASGINRVSELDWSDHIPAEWAGRAVAWLCTGDGGGFRGEDVSLRDPAIRRLVGLA